MFDAQDVYSLSMAVKPALLSMTSAYNKIGEAMVEILT